MKRSVLFFAFASILKFVVAQTTFSEAKFFAAIASEDLSLVDNQIKTITKSSIKEKDAYVGALLMKKAGLISPVRSKLSSFREGHTKLEHAIEKDPGNATYRFLRLIIQENAPGILNYNDDIDKDSQYINQVFETLSPMVQNVVMDYGKTSKALRIEKVTRCSTTKT